VKPHRFIPLALTLCGLPLAAFAQPPAPFPVPAGAKEAGSTVTLSPFEVSEDRDQGYAASHSLAGGRVNTELIKTPADVTVLTREFLRDIGALDYLDAAPYMTSMGQTSPVVTTDFGHNQSIFRGLPAGVQMRNYFRVTRPVDGYIIERLEGLRGPNSLLFGDGALGGGLNTMTKRARTGRSFGEVTLRADSEGSRYGALDVNRMLNPTTALRANLFGQQARYRIERKFDDRSAVDLAALHRPWAGGEIRLEGEYGKSSTNYPPPFFRESYTNYNGTYRVAAPLVAAAPAGTGVTRLTTDTLVWSPTQVGRVQNLLNFGRTTGTNLAVGPEVLAAVPALVPVSRHQSVQPRNGTGDIRHYLLNATFEQQLSRDLVAEFAVQFVQNARHARNQKWDGSFIDVNAVLPDGTPNPKVGKVYGETPWRWYKQDTDHFDLRTALAYRLPVRRWSQRVNAFLFRRREITDYETFMIGRNNNPLNPLINATVNEPAFRIYWDDPQPRFVPPPDDAVNRWETLRTTDQRVIQTIASAQAATVAEFWQDRVSVVAGVRLDDYRQRQRDGAARDAAGRFITQTWQDAAARPVTSSGGLVFFPIRPLGVYGNHAETFNPATSGGRGLNGEVFGPTKSHSWSGGVRFRLADDRVVGSLGWYTMQEKGRLLQYQSAAINRIWTNLNKGELQVDPALTNYRDSLDYAGSGVELDLTANLWRNLRLRGNVAKPRTSQTRTVPGLRTYYAKYAAEWRAGAADPANPNRAQIATDLASLETTMSNANEGRVLNNTPDYTGSVFAMYSVPAGPLKGLRFGGGVAWQGPRVIGNQINRSYDYIYSSGYHTVNLSLGHVLRVAGRTIDLQFNVTNLLDHGEPIYTGTNTFQNRTLRTSLYYLEPRKAALAATHRF
jgi:outer membrane receptor protein involved in Fe transport